jgi:hypothetical protein
MRVLLLSILAVAFLLPASAQNGPAYRSRARASSVRYHLLGDRIRIVLQLNHAVTYLEGTANEPYRLFFDLHGAGQAALASRTSIRDPLLQRIRVAQYQPGITRVVLDLNQRTQYRTSVLTNPPRLMIDVLRSTMVRQPIDTGAPSSPPWPRMQVVHQIPNAATRAANMTAKAYPPVLWPEQIPAVAPEVSYGNGQLTIVANNCTLARILSAVAERTGAVVDAPVNLTTDHVAGRLGPGSPRNVLIELLAGSDFDYILIGDDHDPNAVRSVILIADPSLPASTVAQTVPQEKRGEELHTVEQIEPEQPLTQQPPQHVDGQRVSAGTHAGEGSHPPGAETPEQLLEELRRLQDEDEQPNNL